ncbi:MULTISPECIES: hypothetical protein [unclassified Bradyrhizobium]|uniref:hypothetical protein n=1 Tax=unclassified Bradyrhizobium TaxID=2631580 RepID=UPI003390BE19
MSVALVLHYDDDTAAKAALTAIGIDTSYGFPPDGRVNGTYFNIDAYNGASGVLFDENNNQLPGFYCGFLWDGDESTCPDFGAAVCDPPPATAPVWGRAAS